MNLDRKSACEILVALLSYAIASVLLTWPMSVSVGQAVAARGDYALNLWNFWWLRQVFMHDGASLYWSNAVFHPLGVSLARHELSPFNAAAGALLSSFVDPHVAFSALTWVHFWSSASIFYLFARALTGSQTGALIAGLFWSFSPFHFYYLAQLNVSTLEFLPLAGWAMVRTYRKGGVANSLGVVLAACLIAATSSYYVVYAALLGGSLLLGGRLWAPEVYWRSGAARLAVAGFCAALAVVTLAWPLLRSGVDPSDASGVVQAASREMLVRSSDLLGFSWVGPPEHVIVSWPTMLGWSGLLLAACGIRWQRQRIFWLVLALAFGLLSLGPSLHVAGRDVGLRLPYALLADLPGLWMLRKPDRMLALAQLPIGVLIAFGWKSLASRLSVQRWRVAIAASVATVLAFERFAAPLSTYPIPDARYWDALAREPDVGAVVHLPHGGGTPADGRASLLQTRHGKPIPQGYVVDLALGPEHLALAESWMRAYDRLADGDARFVAELARRDRIDRVILHKTNVQQRPRGRLHGQIIYAPFVFVRADLVAMRQQGPFVEVPMETALLARRQAALSAQFGKPVYDDDRLTAYRVADAGQP